MSKDSDRCSFPYINLPCLANRGVLAGHLIPCAACADSVNEMRGLMIESLPFKIGSTVVSTAPDFYPQHVGVVTLVRTGADPTMFPSGIDVSVALHKYPGVCAFDAGDLALVESEAVSAD